MLKPAITMARKAEVRVDRAANVLSRPLIGSLRVGLWVVTALNAVLLLDQGQTEKIPETESLHYLQNFRGRTRRNLARES